MSEMKFSTLIITLLLFMALTSCGGGDIQTADGGIGGTGVTQGKVSGFGSIFVNGVEFDTDNADFIYEEEISETIGNDSGIKVGMVVHITGSSEDGITGVADIVEYAKLLKGTISSNSVGTSETGTLVAMSQNITVDPDTVYDDGGTSIPLSGLFQDAVIEVSGFTDGDGNILATRIDLVSLTDLNETLEIKGFVSSLDETTDTFWIGTLSVDYSGLTLPTDITNGIYVEVKGTIVVDVLFATFVEIEGDGDLSIAEDGEEAELEGFVTSDTTTDPETGNPVFTLNGQQVMVDDSTEYEPEEETVTSIAIGMSLEVEGVMVGTTLLASKVEIRTSAGEKQELKATVEQVNLTDGTLSLLGQIVKVTSSTIYEDEVDEDQSFSLSSLNEVLDFVEIDLYIDLDGSLVASKLERKINESTPNHAEIEGLVEEIDVGGDSNLIRVLDVLIDISNTEITTPAVDDRVDLEGTYDASTGILTAESGEIEQPDE
jgi:hypothetical protein